MRNILLLSVLVLTFGVTTLTADVKKRTPFDLEAYNIAFAVDSLVREKGWANLDLSSTEAVFRALIDARSMNAGTGERDALVKTQSERFKVIVNREAVCVVDLKKKSTEYDGPLVLYFEFLSKGHGTGPSQTLSER
jgi:hypothetical protein